MLSIRKPKWFVCRFHYWGATLLRVSSIFKKYEFLIHTICGNQSCLTNGVFLSTNSSGKKKLGPTWGEKAGNRCQSVGKKDKRRRERRRNLSIDLTPIRRLPGMRLTITYFEDLFNFIVWESTTLMTTFFFHFKMRRTISLSIFLPCVPTPDFPPLFRHGKKGERKLGRRIGRGERKRAILLTSPFPFPTQEFGDKDVTSIPERLG